MFDPKEPTNKQQIDISTTSLNFSIPSLELNNSVVPLSQFSETNYIENQHSKPRNTKYFRQRKLRHKQISESKINDSKSDNRPYADVFVAGYSYKGLLDSGANLSVLGAGSLEFIREIDVKLYPFKSYISTASGSKQKVVGYINTTVEYEGKTKMMRLFVIPSLQQNLYLGMDFWEKYGIKPVMIEEIGPSDPEVNIKEDNCHELSPEWQSKLLNVIDSLPDFNKQGLGRTSLVCHYIDVGDARPIKQRYYPVSPAVQKIIDEEVERMLKMDVIKLSNSPWCSPMAIVKKSNGKFRLCLDARKLNDITKKNAYPLPNIEGLLSRLGQTRYISSLDLKDAFWQIPLDPGSREKTAFVIPGHPLYEFTCMPFGLCNAPQTLCELMHKVIPYQLHSKVFVYLDDLLIMTETLAEHIDLLAEVGKRLRAANLTINIEKSKFVLKKLKYLGYIVGGGCLMTNPEKVNAIAEFPKPKNTRQIRQFLGVAAWYQRFIRNYSSVASPLSDLLKKRQKFIWSESAQTSFDNLKNALISAPILVNPDFTKRFYIQCDASSTGVGSVLFQVSDSGVENPIAYMSKKLNSAQRNYSVSELECLAAFLSIKKFRCYVEGHPFTVITDHSSLKWLMNQKDLTGRLARWSLKLQMYDFDIEYKSGAQNIVPDSLSRVYSEEVALVVDEIVEDLSPPFIDYESPAFKEPEYLEILKCINESSDPILNMCCMDGKAYINPSSGLVFENSYVPAWKLIVPKSLIQGLIKQFHDAPCSSHSGFEKTLEKARRYFYWKRMAGDIRDYVKKCDVCKQSKPANYIMRPLMGKQTTTQRTWQRIFVDFMGPYPLSKNRNMYLLVVLDHFSRFLLVQPIKNATAQILVDYLENEVFLKYSVPEIMVSDNGKQFDSNLLKKLLKKYGVTQVFTGKYSPQANASERTNRSILSAIRSYISENHQLWDQHIQEIRLALCNVVHSSTGFTPHFLMHGQHWIGNGSDYALIERLNFIDNNDVHLSLNSDRLTLAQKTVLENLEKAYLKSAKHYNLRARDRKFKPQQIVFLKNFSLSDAGKRYCAKLGPKFLKVKVVKRVGNVLYELMDLSGKQLGVFHAKDIK